jgi:bla regulator protein BlaR1
MMENCLSAAWHAAALALGNHLWQSTLVAAAAALLTLALRKHHARARYCIWLAASIKFLVPFSLLVAAGSHLAWQRHPAQTTKPALYFAIEEISQPFTQAAVRVASAPRVSPISAGLMHLLPWIAAVWLSGFLVVLLIWSLRWRKIVAAMKAASPSREGRELSALRRIERIGGIHKPIVLLLSPASLEPGIFGIARPALIWPEGISPRLEDAHLEAILAHEVWHVRRRDNLAAALHMLVEAVFWFHPLVWWLGARLVEERERACDEQVVAWGSDPQIYAESILKVCEFCLGSPLVCVSGVTGADLKQRMVHIMSDRMLHKLNFARKLLLTAAAFLAIAAPITFGLFHATAIQAQPQADSISSVAPTFESVSIKPSPDTGGKFYAKTMFSLQDGSFTARGVTLQRLIQMAYRVQDTQISGPVELNATKFDIDAKLNRGVADALLKQQKGLDDQLALKTLLAQRFKLVLHPEARNLPVYHLVVAEGGSKMQESKSGRFIHFERGELDSQGIPIRILTEQLSQILGQTVLDGTGLAGNYIFTLRWTPDAAEDARFRAAEAVMGAKAPGSPDPNGPPLATALEQQLGLKLEPNTEPVQVLVVDHVEMPSAN